MSNSCHVFIWVICFINSNWHQTVCYQYWQIILIYLIYSQFIINSHDHSVVYYVFVYVVLSVNVLTVEWEQIQQWMNIYFDQSSFLTHSFIYSVSVINFIYRTRIRFIWFRFLFLLWFIAAHTKENSSKFFHLHVVDFDIHRYNIQLRI